MRSLLTRFRRRLSLDDMAAATLGTVSALERSGCRVLGAQLLPMPRVHIDRPPSGLHTCGYLEPPRFARCVPVEHYAVVDGVRVTWFALAGGRHV